MTEQKHLSQHSEDSCTCGCEHHEHHSHHEHHECDDHHHKHHVHHEHCECHDEHNHHEHQGCHDHHDHHQEHISGPIHITHHDGALIGALRTDLSIEDYSEAEKKLTQQMRALARRIDEAGGIIGHIKINLFSQEHASRISITDFEEDISHFHGGCRMEGVVIVFHLTDETLYDLIMETVGTLIQI